MAKCCSRSGPSRSAAPMSTSRATHTRGRSTSRWCSAMNSAARSRKLGRGVDGLPGGRSRRQRNRCRDLRFVPALPDGPLQPVPVTEGIRVRRRRRDGPVRSRAGAMPAPYSRFVAFRHRVPGRASRRRLSGDVRQLQNRARRFRRRRRAGPDRAAVHANGGVIRREHARRRWPLGDRPRLEAARRLGRRTPSTSRRRIWRRSFAIICPIGADVVCDASGASATLETALRLTRPDGQVSKVGWSPDSIPTDVNPLVFRNIRLQGSFSHNYRSGSASSACSTAA